MSLEKQGGKLKERSKRKENIEIKLSVSKTQDGHEQNKGK